MFELTTNGLSRKLDSNSFAYPRQGEEDRKKRTFEFPDLLKSRIDSSRLLFPKGVLSKIREGAEDIQPVKRIELFAQGRADTYGIIRSLFVGFSSERSILQIAEMTGGVVQVRAVRVSKGTVKEAASHEKSGDTILLKRASAETTDQIGNSGFRLRIPSITISPRWKDRMKLTDDDRLMVSNPIQDYAVPPPNV